MTTQQLNILKKSAYIVAVLLLGGVVLYLSSGGNFYRSSILDELQTNDPNALTASGIVLDSTFNSAGSFNDLFSSNVNTETGSTNVTADEVNPISPTGDGSGGTDAFNLAPVDFSGLVSENVNTQPVITEPIVENTNVLVTPPVEDVNRFSANENTNTTVFADVNKDYLTMEAGASIVTAREPVTGEVAMTSNIKVTKVPKTGPADLLLLFVAIATSLFLSLRKYNRSL